MQITLGKKIRKLIMILVISLTTNSYSNVIYDKNNIIISKLDLDHYKQLHYQKFEKEINDSKALKNLVVIKKVIKKMKKTTPDFINRIDNNIFKGMGDEKVESETIMDTIRYFNIRNEFIYDYYYNFFNISDLEYVFNSFDKFELPISLNKCLTIFKLVNIKDNSDFIKSYYENISSQDSNYEIFIDDKKYEVCIDSRSNKIIEKEIFKFIDIKIDKNFERFVYENQKQ